MVDLHSTPLSSAPIPSAAPPGWCPEPGFPRGFCRCWAVAYPFLVFPAAEKVSSLGKDWHKFCLKCERCNKTLTPGGHAEVRAAGADGVGEDAVPCRGGLVISPALQRQGVPGIGLGQVPDAMRMGCPCGTQAQERTLWLQMLRPVVVQSCRAWCWASHRVVLAPCVVPSPVWAPRQPVVGLGMPWQALEAAPCTGQACLGIAVALKACGCMAVSLKTPKIRDTLVAMVMLARHRCFRCPGACSGV